MAREAAWAPLAVLIVHTVAGSALGHEPYVDPVMHFLGGAAAAFFFRRAASLATTLLGALTPVALDLFAFGLTCSIAFFWEVGEFAGDQLLGSHVQRGLSNTMRDMILGVGGGLLFLFLSRVVPFVSARAMSGSRAGF